MGYEPGFINICNQIRSEIQPRMVGVYFKKMKKISLLVLLILCCKLSIAQNIIGRWQAQSGIISNERGENYQFFANGMFCFNTYDDDRLSRVEKICGKYSFAKQELIFIPSYYMEWTGGSLTLTAAEIGTSRWGFDSTKIKKVIIKNPEKQKVPIKLYKKQNMEILDIDGTQYYKINNDPEKY